MITVGVKHPFEHFCSYLSITIGLYLHWMMNGSMVMEMTEPDQLEQLGEWDLDRQITGPAPYRLSLGQIQKYLFSVERPRD